MRKSYLSIVFYFLLCITLLAASGCAGMVDYLPAPPAALVKIELKGPYDKDIPERYQNYLKGASITSDWAIPYIFMSIGLHFESVGDEERTIHFYDRSIEEFRKRNDIYGEGSGINRKVFALHEFGKIQEAFRIIREKEKVWVTPPMKAFVDHNYGHYFLMNGDYVKAISYFRKAFTENPQFRDDFNLLMLRRDSELELGISTILADYVPSMSRKYSLLEFDQAMYETIRKNVDEGIRHLDQVLILNQDIRKTRVGRFTPEAVFQIMETNVYNFLGLANGIKGNWGESRKYLAMSADLAGKAGFRTGEIDSIFFLNQVYLLEKNITEGLKAAERFNEAADRYRFPFYQVWAKYILSRYYTGFGDTAKAIATLKEAIAIIERQRSSLAIDVLKETYLHNRQMVYEALVELLAREGDFRGALEIAERAKSRVLVDLLAGKDISRNPAEAELLKEEGLVNEALIKVHKQMRRVSGEEGIKDLTGKIEKAEETQRSIILKIKSQNEELFSLVSVQSPEPSDIQKLLDHRTTLVDYFVTDTMLYAWAIRKEGIHLERIKIGRSDLRNLASSFLSAVAAKDVEKTGLLSRKIYDLILKPVMPFISGDMMGIIPHDSLYYLPFAALSHEGRYAVDRFSIFYLPNAGVLRYVTGRQASKGLKILAFGNPYLGTKNSDLPYAVREVEKIKKRIAQTTVFLGKQATKEKAMGMLGDYDIVHFATHGQFVPEFPMESSLLLAPGSRDDGRLTALEILRLRFRGRAIVLSACETALGISSTGTEIVGFNRSFLYAGSPSVVSTLWSIDDEATAYLMDSFYKHLERKEDVAAALRLAQLDMIRKGYAPYYWAPFILTGRY